MARDGRRTRLTSTALVSRLTEASNWADASWNSDSNVSSRDICYNNGVRADGDIITNRNRSEQLQRRLQCRRGSRWLAKSRAVDSGALRWKPPLTSCTDR